jgi:ATP-dependent exoDNAse (exonuclease V) beta subunit
MSEAMEAAYLAALDESQKAAVLAETNCIVTAGAGAGKTSVLVARCLHLVLGRKLPLRSILALTFTRKAAAEMYERIYTELAKDDSPWAREQLADFQNSHITTLDAFCSEIARSSASDWGYTKDFSVDEKRSRDLALTIARSFVAKNRAKPGLAEMLRSFPFEQVVSDFFGDIGSRMASPLRLQAPLFGPMGGMLEAFADEESRKRMKELADLARDIAASGAEVQAPRAGCTAAMAAARNFLVHLDGRVRSFRGLVEVSADLAAFDDLKLTSFGRSAEETAVKELAGEARAQARYLQKLAAYIDVYPSYLEVLKRLDEYALDLAEAKRLADLMDYKDLGLSAVYALKENKDLRSYWKRRIRSILIDEFQDNNSLQKELLFLLAERKDRSAEGAPGSEDLEEGKLFLVGDEKQSIYRFRGADVSVFKTLAGELESGTSPGSTARRSLSSNYRSAAGLIDFFNALFARVMNADEGPEKPVYSASYFPMEKGKPGTGEDAPSSIQYYRLADDDDEENDEEGPEEAEFPARDEDSATLEPDEALAFSIARFIQESKNTLETRKGKAEYGDFAVLFKTTTNQHRLEKHLRLRGIPFDSDSPRGLFRESPANDIYSLLSLLLDPGDRAAYAAVLRGPFCRLSDQGFLTLMTEASRPFEHKGQTPLSKADAEALAEAAAFFAELKAKAASATGSSSAAELVDFIWREGGLRIATLSEPASQPFLEHFDYLFRLAADVDAQSGGLAAFRSLLRPCIEDGEEKIEVENVLKSAAGGVKLLTIHKAKGLQFPIVIVPWVENALNPRREAALWCPLSSPHGASLAIDSKAFDMPGAKAVNVFLDLAKQEEKAKAEAELKRLLYVACTRAEDHLFFFGKTPRRAGTRESSFRGLLEGFVDSGGRLETVELSPVRREELVGLRRSSNLPSIGAFAAGYAATPALVEKWPWSSFTATELSELACKKAEAPHSKGSLDAQAPIDAKLFGTLCHAAVEYAAERNSTEGFSPPEALLRGIEPGKVAAAMVQAVGLAEGFLESPLWLDLKERGKPQLEKSFLLSVGGSLVDGRMDLFLESDEDVTILDFKSDSRTEPERYAVQLDIYRRAALGICGGKAVKAGIFWLRAKETTWLDESGDPGSLERLIEEAKNALEEKDEA